MSIVKVFIIAAIGGIFFGYGLGLHFGKLDFTNNLKHWENGFEAGTTMSGSPLKTIAECQRNGQKAGLDMSLMVVHELKSNHEEITWCITEKTAKILLKIMNERKIKGGQHEH